MHLYGIKFQIMKNLYAFILLVLTFTCLHAQQIIELPYEVPSDVKWEGGEKEYVSKIWINTKVVTNVSVPTLQIYKPEPSINTGTAVVIAPGGGLYALSIESEGTSVAEWLVKKGITALVLKYRLVPSGEDGVAEVTELMQNSPEKMFEHVANVIPYSVSDGLEAIKYARSHASQLGIDPQKIGLMGFSAGGAVTMGVAYQFKEDSQPNFLVPVYAWTYAMPVQKPQAGSPPMLLVCATDDSLGLAPGTIDIYNSWIENELSVGLHMYAKGDHGFGMRKQNLPSDHWIERFYEWSVSQGITVPKN